MRRTVGFAACQLPARTIAFLFARDATGMTWLQGARWRERYVMPSEGTRSG